MPSLRLLLRLIGSTAALLLVALRDPSSTVQAHASLNINDKPIAKFEGCGFCPIGDYAVPPSIPKTLQNKELFAFLTKNKKTVRQLWTETIAMPSEGDDKDVADKSPQSCGRSDIKHVVNAFAATDKIALGITSHYGPAETYVNDKLVAQIEDAHTAGPMSLSAFDCDQPVCEVRWYWMNVDWIHEAFDGKQPYVQLFVNCFSIKGNGKPIRVIGGGGDSGADSEAPTPTTTRKPVKSASNTKAPTSPPTEDGWTTKWETIKPATLEDGGESDGNYTVDDDTPTTVATAKTRKDTWATTSKTVKPATAPRPKWATFQTTASPSTK